MKKLLLILSYLSFATALPNFAQQGNPFLNCLRTPNPTHQSLNQARIALNSNKVAVYYVVPKDAAYSQAEYDAIRKASREIQAWFQINTGGVTYTFAYPDTVIFYQGLQNTSYYQQDWWGRLLSEMQQQGVPIWQTGTVASLWIKTGQPGGIGLGAQWCNSYCGVAMAGVENFPEFNQSGICPNNPGGFMWPCVPHATMAHELGHAFGLPHPVDAEETHEVAYHSIMQTHWNYPNIAPPNESPWGLLTVERTKLWANPFFQEGISLRQMYDADVVNLPITGQAPVISINHKVKGKTITLTNNTSGAQLYYWTFGDGTVSNEQSPSHTYSQPGTYTVALRASSATGMTALQEFTVEVKDQEKKPKTISLGPVKIYPNPSLDGRFTITFPPLPFPFRLTVYNAMGNIIFSEALTKNARSLELDVSPFGRGIFYVKLELMGAVLTQKLVVL